METLGSSINLFQTIEQGGPARPLTGAENDTFGSVLDPLHKGSGIEKRSNQTRSGRSFPSEDLGNRRSFCLVREEVGHFCQETKKDCLDSDNH